MKIRQVEEFKKNSEAYKRLCEVSDVDSLTPEERYVYEADLKIVRDTINQIRGAYLAGIAVGTAEARVEGKESERQKGIQIMLSLGISPELIAEKFKISPKEVIRLSENTQ